MHNPLKIVVATTNTLHHTHFVRELMKSFPLTCVLTESQVNSASFETFHSFESIRDEYERKVFFQGMNTCLEDISVHHTFKTLNEPDALSLLTEISPEILIVFGTGKLSKNVIDICPNGIINLHGGDPEEYRGLDTHLWAIYHNDFNRLITTLHRLNEKLDDGDIILQAPVKLYPGMEIYELRRYNTEICIQLVLSALDIYKRSGHFIARPQRRWGRYYSHMPAPLKGICVDIFHRFTAALK
jgi:methionyl-tRNA formyltransferase